MIHPDTNVMFQVVNHSIGTRTPAVKVPFGDLVDEFEKMASELADDEQHNYLEDLILLVSDDKEGAMLISDFPLMKIKNFIPVGRKIINNAMQEQNHA